MSDETTAVALRDQSTELSVDQVLASVALIEDVMSRVLKRDKHYGIIPGTEKPTLYKAGAEKLGVTFRLAPEYEEQVIDLGNGHREYRFKCRLRHIVTGAILGEGVGSCSTMESKYRWRTQQRTCPTCGAEAVIKGKNEYGGGWLCWKKKDGCGAKFKTGDKAIEDQEAGRIENPDIADVWNTAYKIGKKRSYIDCTLTATATSDILTQDMEDTTATPPENEGAAYLAKLFAMITDALRDKTLTQKQFADTALGLAGYLAKHPENNVGDYNRDVESKLKKKREPKDVTPDPTHTQTMNAGSGNGTPTATASAARNRSRIDAALNPDDDPVIADEKGKADMLDGINRTAEKAGENPEDGELGIF